MVALEGLGRNGGWFENSVHFLSDHEYVGFTAGLQQGQGALLMAVVYSLVQSCFTFLQHRCKNKGLSLRHFNSISWLSPFILIFRRCYRHSDGVYHWFQSKKKNWVDLIRRHLHVRDQFPSRTHLPDITVTTQTLAMQQQWSSGLAAQHTRLKRMFALIPYRIGFIPSIEVQQQQMDGVQVSVTGS